MKKNREINNSHHTNNKRHTLLDNVINSTTDLFNETDLSESDCLNKLAKLANTLSSNASSNEKEAFLKLIIDLETEISTRKFGSKLYLTVISVNSSPDETQQNTSELSQLKRPTQDFQRLISNHFDTISKLKCELQIIQNELEALDKKLNSFNLTPFQIFNTRETLRVSKDNKRAIEKELNEWKSPTNSIRNTKDFENHKKTLERKLEETNCIIKEAENSLKQLSQSEIPKQTTMKREAKKIKLHQQITLKKEEITQAKKCLCNKLLALNT